MNWAFHPDFGGQVAYDIKALPEHPDGQVRETMREIVRYLRADASSPLITEDAMRALDLGQGDPIRGVWSWVKPRIRFKQDADLAQDLAIDDPRKPDVIEVVIRPVDQSLLIRMFGRGFEDCDGFTLYGGCLLSALGVPVSLATVAADADEPYRFSHVYVVAYHNGERIPLDFSHGPYPGWECPNMGRIKEWPLQESISSSLTVLAPIAIAAAAYLAVRYFERRIQ